MKLLSTTNAKIRKGEKYGYTTFGLSLAPSRLSGYQTCPMASAGCAAACLNTAGMGAFSNVQTARIEKTRWFFQNRETFMAQLVRDIRSAIAKAHKQNMTPVFRLNIVSDLRWETVPVTVNGTEYANVMEAFPEVTFYDYTKLSNRRNIPANYRLTFSRSEENEAQALEWLRNGGNVAVVFSGTLPETWNGYRVVDGDLSDLRFLDPSNVVVGLKAKGKAKKDSSGFVIPS